jgi:hypothetical protein
MLKISTKTIGKNLDTGADESISADETENHGWT